MDLWSHDRFTFPLAATHRFPLSKYPLLRARLRAGVAERDTRLAAGMSRAGVPLHRIGTDADLATALIEVVASTQRRRA